MKTPSRRKTRSPKAKAVSPPATALGKLETAACRDHALARLTLGFIGAILRDESSPLFANYHWCRRDLGLFPQKLRSAVRALDLWGQRPDINVYPLYVCAKNITAAVVKMRRGSPFGRRCIEIAEKFRARFPRSNKPYFYTSPGATRVQNVDILESYAGLPLSHRTMTVVEALKASSIQISTHEEYLNFSDDVGVVRILLAADGYTVKSIDLALEVNAPVGKPTTIEGELLDFSETGTEGLRWSIEDDANFSYDALHLIHEGDHLTVSDNLGNKIWAGTIECDAEAGWQRYPLNPKSGQPSALGYWIRWTQKGFKPDDWARFFVRPDYDRFHGVLVRKAGEAGLVPETPQTSEGHPATPRPIPEN